MAASPPATKRQPMWISNLEGKWEKHAQQEAIGYGDYVRNKGKGNDVGKNIKGKGIVGIKGTRRPLATPVVGDDIVQVAVYGKGKVGHAKIINKGYEGRQQRHE